MPRTHRPSKVDANQPEIVEALRRAGWVVFHLHSVGGILDLLISKPNGYSCLLECKMPGARLTPAESKFCMSWPGDYVIAYSGADAVDKANTLYGCWERLPFTEAAHGD